MTSQIKAIPKILWISTILGLGVISYSTSLNGEFFSDDYKVIVNNPAVKDITDIKEIWRSFNTRFLPGLSFAFNYSLGQLNPWGYHLFNLGCHILVSFPVYQFVYLTFQTPALINTFLNPHASLVAFYSSLIFLCHPIQTQAVSFITQRFVPMAAFFYLSTLILYIKARLTGENIFFILAFIVMVAGMFTKEWMITLPLMLIVYEFYFFGHWKYNGFKRLILGLAFSLAILVLPLAILLSPSGTMLNLKGQLSHASFEWAYFLTEINVLRTYLRLLFFPINLNHGYMYPLSKGILEFSTLASLAWLLAIFGVAVFQFKKTVCLVLLLYGFL